MSLFSLLGKPETVSFMGRTFEVEPLTFEDVADIAKKYGVNLYDLEGQEFAMEFIYQGVIWAVLRKQDPRLSDEEKAAGKYRLTPEELAREIPIKAMVTEDGQKFFRAIMVHSGLQKPEDEASEGDNDEGNLAAAND